MSGEGSSLLGERSNCPFYSRIRHEDVLLKLLHSSGWREIPGITKFVDTLQKQPSFTSANQGQFQTRGKDATVKSCGIPWSTSTEFTRGNPQQLPEAGSGPSALIAAGCRGSQHRAAAWGTRPCWNLYMPSFLCFANRYWTRKQKKLKEGI